MCEILFALFNFFMFIAAPKLISFNGSILWVSVVFFMSRAVSRHVRATNFLFG